MQVLRQLVEEERGLSGCDLSLGFSMAEAMAEMESEDGIVEKESRVPTRMELRRVFFAMGIKRLFGTLARSVAGES